MTPSPIKNSCSGPPCGSLSRHPIRAAVAPSIIIIVNAAKSALSDLTRTCTDVLLPSEKVLVAVTCLQKDRRRWQQEPGDREAKVRPGRQAFPRPCSQKVPSSAHRGDCLIGAKRITFKALSLPPIFLFHVLILNQPLSCQPAPGAPGAAPGSASPGAPWPPELRLPVDLGSLSPVIKSNSIQ